jgi:hypothetical protein
LHLATPELTPWRDANNGGLCPKYHLYLAMMKVMEVHEEVKRLHEEVNRLYETLLKEKN